jgi:hypothetical protein
MTKILTGAILKKVFISGFADSGKICWLFYFLFKTFHAQVQVMQQEGHDGSEIAHLYIGHQSGANFNTGFYLNKFGRHPFENVS